MREGVATDVLVAREALAAHLHHHTPPAAGAAGAGAGAAGAAVGATGAARETAAGVARATGR